MSCTLQRLPLARFARAPPSFPEFALRTLSSSCSSTSEPAEFASPPSPQSSAVVPPPESSAASPSPASDSIEFSSTAPPGAADAAARSQTGSQTQGDSAESLFSSAPAPETPAADAGFENLNRKENGLWRLFKIVLAGTLVAGSAGSAYATYAFTSDQIEKRISEVRRSTEVHSNENDSLLQRVQDVLHSTTVKGAARIAELYLEIRKSIEEQVRGFAAPSSDKLLPDLAPQEQHVFTLVLDLNETLVYSDWKRDRGWRTFKRPGVDSFLEHLAQYYELVIYSDQLSFYVDPILERLDQKGCIRYRLSREATQYVHGKHYRDLSKLNRNPSRVLYLSAHASETCLQPENAVPVKPWKLETDDTTLLDLLPFLEYVARYRPADIRPVLSSYSGHDIPSEFRERTKEYQKKNARAEKTKSLFQGTFSDTVKPVAVAIPICKFQLIIFDVFVTYFSDSQPGLEGIFKQWGSQPAACFSVSCKLAKQYNSSCHFFIAAMIEFWEGKG